MSILGILYSLIISPLVLIFDVIFTLVLNKILYVGWSIVILSLIVNTLVLPLYNRADEIQARESEKKQKIKKWEEHIKRHFKGDERFMMLQTFYRENDYKPYQTLRGALPLLLEIPFFIAAYQYLSGLQLLVGYGFGPIKDLSLPDHILSVFGYSINVMPILMTIINLISSLMYNRSSSFRDKIQLFIIAFVFLVLLYNSPSGLVLYWTCNNIYSLCKNIVYRFIIKDKFVNKKQIEEPKNRSITMIFVGSSLILALLIGTYIPLELLGSSVDEFISFATMINPSLYVLNSTLIAVGLLFVWVGVYFYLSHSKGRYVISTIIMSLCIISFFDYIIIPFDSSMTKFLTVDSVTEATTKLVIQNFAIIITVVLLCFFAIKYKKVAFGFISIFTLIPFIFVCAFSFIKVNSVASEKIAMLKKYDDIPEVHFSKNGKNVVVIMMDRMIGYYVPFIMDENPELYDSWDGFTFYPNCISYGTATNVGSPALYGGYDYRPEKINERSDVSLVDKQNEALSVMPVLFGENGYDVTVGNPTYAGYDWIPDLSIYDDYPFIYKYNTGMTLNDDDLYYTYEDVIKRNLVCYGIYRVAPIFLQGEIYDYGRYNSSSIYFNGGIGLVSINSLSKCDGICELFYNAYNVLCSLPKISVINDDDENHFNMFSNDTTHEACLLAEPSYELSPFVDNTDYDNEHSIKTTKDGNTIDLYSEKINFEDKTSNDFKLKKVIDYHTNTAAMLKLGLWFDYLREEGIYDNTRIIIVSDHSDTLELDPDLKCVLSFDDSDPEYYDLLSSQSCLLVKDFNSSGFTTNKDFMTNADVPTLASNNLIDNPINPFTGNIIDSSPKNEPKQNIIFTSSWHTEENDGYKLRKSQWFSVHDNIFDVNNWKYEGAH